MMMRLWAIARSNPVAGKAPVGMFGDLSGIAGRALQESDGLDVPFESPANRSIKNKTWTLNSWISRLRRGSRESPERSGRGSDCRLCRNFSHGFNQPMSTHESTAHAELLSMCGCRARVLGNILTGLTLYAR